MGNTIQVSHFYLSEKMLFQGEDRVFKSAWQHVVKSVCNGHKPASQDELHHAITDIAARITQNEGYNYGN
jgi:hypothetical protein